MKRQLPKPASASRQRFERTFVRKKPEGHGTLSFGIAVSDERNPVDPQALINLADEALYRAKKLGRNRCELASNPASGVFESVSEPAPLKNESY